MNAFALIFFIATAAGIWAAPRKLAVIIFLIGCCYMTVGQGLVIAELNLPIIRMLVIVGLLRLAVRGEKIAGGFNLMDKLMVLWACWLLFASFFHEWAPGSGPIYTCGVLLNTIGFYFMIRSFCLDPDELVDVLAALCLILAPVAVFMFIEQALHWNVFSIFGGVPESPLLRNGRFRAQGPFNHAILAGTVGAACFPFAVAIWNRNRMAAIIGAISCLVMVFASASSGPIMSTGFAVLALCLWKCRPLVRFMQIAAVLVYLLLELVMNRPAYFLISRIDLTGASSAWHRSYLIQQTMRHLDEWWLFGTDRTVHWMPNQGRISDIQTDITNQYIAFGVAGGVVSVGLLIVMIWLTFRSVGRISARTEVSAQHQFVFWCMGSSLFALVASGVSVSYFGQSLFFFWFPIAAMGSFCMLGSSPSLADGDGWEVSNDEGSEEFSEGYCR